MTDDAGALAHAFLGQLGGLEPLLAARDRRTRRAAYRAATTGGLLSLRRLTTAAMKDEDLPMELVVLEAHDPDPGVGGDLGVAVGQPADPQPAY